MKHVVQLRGVPYFKRRNYGAFPLPTDETFEEAYQQHLKASQSAREFMGKGIPDIEQFMPRVLRNMSSAKKRAKLQGVSYGLSENWFRDRYSKIKGQCELTGIRFSEDRPKHPPFAPSIDRLVSSLGYVDGNCRIVTYMANCARNQFTDQEFRQMCRAATQNWERAKYDQ